MKTVQEVFNMAISSGLYGIANNPILREPNYVTVNGQTINVSSYMCTAIEGLRYCKAITNAECYAAQEEIDTYLGDYSFLSMALRDSGLSDSLEYRRAIYENWSSRPRLKM